MLVTVLQPTGIAIGVCPEAPIAMDALTVHEVRSESYLRVIEETVASHGGWEAMETWAVHLEGESFTSLRGLLTLVNTLAPLHALTVKKMDAEGRVEAEVCTLPLEPVYASEPNIGSRAA